MITLQPGDYVYVGDLSNEEIQRLADKFVEAGATDLDGGEFDQDKFPYLLWDASDDVWCADTTVSTQGKRQLTVEQVLGTEKMITLQPGDYISTEGLTEEQYHAVAEAFMDAGAGEGEYPRLHDIKKYNGFGWNEAGGGLFHYDVEDVTDSFTGRQLTVDQVLGTSWQGDGLPPVGAVCEGFFEWGASKKWRKMEILRHSESGKECAVYVPELGPALGWCREFRPIRSEEDDAKHEMSIVIADALGMASPDWWEASKAIYAAIRDGKIPGVKLES